MFSTKESKYFSPSLYLEGLRRLRLTGVLFLAFLVFIGGAISISMVIDALSYVNMNISYGKETITPVILSPGIVAVPYLLAPIMTLVAFGFLNRRASSDFYHSIPHTRTSIFLSNFAAIMTWAVVDLLAAMIVPAVIYSAFPMFFRVEIGMAAIAFLALTAMSLLAAASVAIAMSITGTYLNNCIVALMIIVMPRAICTILGSGILEKQPLVTEASLFPFFGTGHNLLLGLPLKFLEGISTSAALMDWVSIGYTTLIGALYCVGALLLFKRRRAEAAEHSSPSRRWQAVFRIALTTLLCSLMCTRLYNGDSEFYIVILYGLAVLLYFSYELVTTRSLRMLPKAIPGLGVVFLLNIAMIGIMVCGNAFIMSYRPQAEDIAAIRMRSGYLGSSTSEYFYPNNYQTLQVIENDLGNVEIRDETAIAIAASELRIAVETIDEHGYLYYNYGTVSMSDSKRVSEVSRYDTVRRVEIDFISRNGIVRRRALKMPTAEYDAFITALEANEQYREAYSSVPPPITEEFELVGCRYDEFTSGKTGEPYTDEQLAPIYETLRQEVSELEFVECVEYYGGTSDILATILFDTRHLSEPWEVGLPISLKYTPKAAQMVLDLMYETYSDITPERFGEIIEGCIMSGGYIYYQFFDYSDKTDGYLVHQYDGVEISNTLIESTTEEPAAFGKDFILVTFESRYYFEELGLYGMMTVALPLNRDFSVDEFERSLAFIEDYKSDGIEYEDYPFTEGAEIAENAGDLTRSASEDTVYPADVPKAAEVTVVLDPDSVSW